MIPERDTYSPEARISGHFWWQWMYGHASVIEQLDEQVTIPGLEKAHHEA
jgi:hypothetical protein